MKKTLLILGLLAFAAHATAQTKRIAHRSHSGSNRTFTMKGEGNFGEPIRFPVIIDSTIPRDSTQLLDSLHRTSVLYHQIPGTGIAGGAGTGISKLSVH